MRAISNLSVALVGFSTASVAITPESSQAVIMAAQSGEALGTALACGLSYEDTIRIRQHINQRIDGLATNLQELARAQTWLRRAVERGEAKAKEDGGRYCPGAIEQARALMSAR